MGGVEWLLVVVAVLIVLGLYLSWSAGRLDRRHHAVESTAAVLDAELLRRSGAALELAASGLLDPATSALLADASARARAASSDHREQAESDLTKVLVAVFGDDEAVTELRTDPLRAEAIDELGRASWRAAYARRSHNAVVRSAQQRHRHRLVRWFRLAGHAPMPQTVEFDDTIPPPLLVGSSPDDDEPSGSVL